MVVIPVVTSSFHLFLNNNMNLQDSWRLLIQNNLLLHRGFTTWKQTEPNTRKGAITQNRIKRQNFTYTMIHLTHFSPVSHFYTPWKWGYRNVTQNWNGLIKDGSHLPQSHMLIHYVLNFNLNFAWTTLIDGSHKLLNEEEVYEAAINSSTCTWSTAAFQFATSCLNCCSVSRYLSKF